MQAKKHVSKQNEKKNVLLQNIKKELLRERSRNQIDNPIIKQAVIFMERNYKKELDLSEVCEVTATNKVRLCKEFKAEMGVTPIDYLWRYRVYVGLHYLLYTKVEINEITRRCGFKTTPHFNRKVKLYVGETPGAFRRKAIGAPITTGKTTDILCIQVHKKEALTLTR